MKIIKRTVDIKNILKYISVFPVTAIIGPRQCGKTFLAKQIKYNHYFDLENPRDLAALENPQITLEDLKGLIVIDEIQRKPELFEVMRYIIDNNPNQKYLILGSASWKFIKQSSESLTGRIGHYFLGGFMPFDVGVDNFKKLWLRGSLPRAYLAKSDRDSFLWLSNYINTFLERDIPQLGISIPSSTLRKFWLMLSHYHANVINYSDIARSFGMSDVTVKKYIDILQSTFMLRLLQPWHSNIKKRVVKNPKIYIRDSGIFHSLMSIENFEQLTLNPKLGASWEGFVIETIARILKKKDDELFFWRTHSGAELDLFWQHQGNNWGVEIKYADAPKITKSMQIAIEDLKLKALWVVYPGKKSYKLGKNIIVIPFTNLQDKWDYKI